VHVDDIDSKLYSFVAINPVIIERSKEIVYLTNGEGCLSVDDPTIGITPRNQYIIWSGFKYLINEDKIIEVKKEKLEGYISIVFQHEYDHLDGILFTSKEFKTIPNAKDVFEISYYDEIKKKLKDEEKLNK